MTVAASLVRCAGCGYVADPDEPYPFRCPREGSDDTDDTDHVMTRLLDVDGVVFPRGEEVNPFLRYRALLHAYHVAAAHGLSDQDYCELVSGLDSSVAGVDGHGFRVTPFFRSAMLSSSLGFASDAGVWVKNEAGNVSGSHKGRHLMGVLIHLAVMERVGVLDPAHRRDLAIASCGNAALAAAVVARAGGWRLRVFVPPDADKGVVRRLAGLQASVVMCPREPGVAGDPAYLRLREELDRGALPFTTQGNENGLTIEGGETLGYELVTQLRAMPVGLDHLIIQVGGGALASSCVQALGEAKDLGVLDRLPRIHTVQTLGAHPLERAYHRVRALLPAGDRPDAAAGQSAGGAAGADVDAVHSAMADAAARRSAFMWPWEEEPKSVATGILDDETYDWRAVVEGMLMTGGQPLVVSEDLLVEANSLAVAKTGIRVDPTGSSGLAGLLALRRSGVIGDHDRVAVLFTGIQR
jgi:threonine synthase